MKSKILIVDDERLLAETISINLEKAGFDTVSAFDGESALALSKSEQPDLIILDVMLPKVSGWEVCRAFRSDAEFRTGAPVLMLTARGEESDKVIGLELGADDYLVKPFSMRELVARVKALLRRSVSTANSAQELGEVITVGPVSMDLGRHEVRVGLNGSAREVKLSLKEYDLLKALLTQSGRAVPRETLLERVWGDDFFGDERTLDVHIRWLREKLEAVPSQPEHILTVRGVGYKFKS